MFAVPHLRDFNVVTLDMIVAWYSMAIATMVMTRKLLKYLEAKYPERTAHFRDIDNLRYAFRITAYTWNRLDTDDPRILYLKR